MTTSLTSITKKFKGFSYGTRLHPVRDWLVLLALAAVLLAASVFWNLWLFARVSNGENISGVSAPAVSHGADLNAMDALFQQRAQEQTKYLQEYRFVDPLKVGG